MARPKLFARFSVSFRKKKGPGLVRKINHIRSIAMALKNLIKSDKLKSRKFWVMFAINTVAAFLTATGAMEPERLESIVKWITGTWLLSQGLEDGAGKLGNQPVPNAGGVSTMVTPEELAAAKEQ